MGDFTFWISLSPSLFAQSEIRTYLLHVKPKSEVDFFVRTQSKGLSEKTELIRLV